MAKVVTITSAPVQAVVILPHAIRLDYGLVFQEDSQPITIPSPAMTLQLQNSDLTPAELSTANTVRAWAQAKIDEHEGL